MRLQVKGKNLELSDSIRSTRSRSCSKLDKQLGDLVQVELELAVEETRRSAKTRSPRRRCSRRVTRCACARPPSDMRASIDGLTAKLLREVKEYREKRRREPRRRAEHNGA